MKNKSKKQKLDTVNEPVLTEYLLNSWRPYVILLVICLLLYGRTLWYGFVYLDDVIIIQKRYSLIRDWWCIISAFKSPYFVTDYYRPIVTISFILDAQICKTAPWFYHVSNLLFHFLTVIATFVLAKKMGLSKLARFFCCLIILVHPLATQTVAWIPGRNDSLAALFVVLAFIYFLMFLKTDRALFFMAHLLFYFVSLITKETAAVLPLVAFVYMRLLHKKESKLINNKKLYVGWAVAIIIWYAIRNTVIDATVEQAQAHDIYSFFNNSFVFFELVGKLFIPNNLSPFPQTNSFSIAIGFIFLTLLAVSAFVLRKRLNNTIFFALCWSIVFVIPGLIIRVAMVESRFEYLESRAYVSVVGIGMLYGFSIDEIVEKLPRFLKYIYIIPVVYCSQTLFYIPVFKDGTSHWTYVLKQTQSSADAFCNRGLVNFEKENNLMDAERNYKKAISLNFQQPVYHNNLGFLYLAEDRVSEAESELRIAVEYNPYNAHYHDDLGIALGRAAKLDSAAIEFNKAIVLEPGFAIPYGNLGYLNYLKKDNILAEKYWQNAIEIDPEYTDPMLKLVYLYYQQGRYSEALKYAKMLEKLDEPINSEMMLRILRQI